MKRRKLRFVYLIPALVLITLSSCSSGDKYVADWIILKAKYQNEDVTKHLGLRNIHIDYGDLAVIPTLLYGEFKEVSIAYEMKCDYYHRDGKDYINLTGSKFLTGEFEVECAGEPCCNLVLKNKDKYLELLFNSEIKSFNRRNCPSSKKFMDDYFSKSN